MEAEAHRRAFIVAVRMVSLATRELAVWLLDHADADGFLVVHRGELAERLGIAPRSVSRSLGELNFARAIERDYPTDRRAAITIRLATFPLPRVEPTAYLPDGSPVEAVLAGAKRRFISGAGADRREPLSLVTSPCHRSTNATASPDSCPDRTHPSVRSHTRSEEEEELRASVIQNKNGQARVRRPRRSTRNEARNPDTPPPERLSDEQRAALDAWGEARGLSVADLRHAEDVTLDWARARGFLRADWLATVRNAIRRRWGLDGAEGARSGALGGATRASEPRPRGRVPASRIMTNTPAPAKPTGGRVDDDW